MDHIRNGQGYEWEAFSIESNRLSFFNAIRIKANLKASKACQVSLYSPLYDNLLHKSLYAGREVYERKQEHYGVQFQHGKIIRNRLLEAVLALHSKEF